MKAENIDHFLHLQESLDKFKIIYRQSLVKGRSQNENDAEHSWHLAMWFITISNSLTGINKEKILLMLLIHDLPELLSGDKFYLDKTSQDEREEIEAAKQLFEKFPKKIGAKLLRLWLEFQENNTREAKIANSIDGLQPIWQNIMTDGRMWREKGVTLKKLDAKKRPLMIHDKVILKIYENLLKRASEFIS